MLASGASASGSIALFSALAHPASVGISGEAECQATVSTPTAGTVSSQLAFGVALVTLRLSASTQATRRLRSPSARWIGQA